MQAGLDSMKNQVNQVKQQVQGAVEQATAEIAPPVWHTERYQTDNVERNDWLFSCFCFPCAAAKAKSNVDKLHPCVNCICWHPIGTYSFIRLAYGINGVCGEDLCYGFWCMCCNTRQAYTESQIRGPLSGAYGTTTEQWKHSLFDCTAHELCETMCCMPCVGHEVRMLLQPKAVESCAFDAFCTLPTAWYSQVRNTYGLLGEGGVAGDIFIGLFCAPCALNRARKEARERLSPGTIGQAVAGALGAKVGLPGLGSKMA